MSVKPFDKNAQSIEVFAICYNEEFMLPHFIKHYQQTFNAKITIYDNMSTDRSRTIIEAAGCKYIQYDSGNTIRDDIYRDIKNMCWKNSEADWVIVCDIDEFLELNFDVSPYTIINTRGYDMIGDPQSRLGVYNSLMSKHIMFRRNNGLTDINYQFGCHRCEPKGNVQGSKEFANLLHRKYISEEYVYARHMEYEKRLSMLNRKYGWGIHYIGTTKKSIQKKFDELRMSVQGIII